MPWASITLLAGTGCTVAHLAANERIMQKCTHGLGFIHEQLINLKRGFAAPAYVAQHLLDRTNEAMQMHPNFVQILTDALNCGVWST